MSRITSKNGYNCLDQHHKTKYNIKGTAPRNESRKPFGKIDCNTKSKPPTRGKTMAKINQERVFASKIISNITKIKKNITSRTNQTARHKKFDFPTTPRNLRYRSIQSPETPLNSYPFDSPVETDTPLRRSQRVRAGSTPASGSKRKRNSPSRSRKSGNGDEGFVRHLEYVVTGIQTLESNSNNCQVGDEITNSCFSETHITPDPDDAEISFKKRRFSNDTMNETKGTKAKQQLGNLKRSVTRMSLRVRNQLTQSASMVAYNAFSKHGSEWNVLASSSPIMPSRNGAHTSRFDWK